jgi:flagellar biosynthesis chaperone FliJ
MADGDQRADGPQEEEAESATPERARHWTAFYQELIGYEERILESMRELSAGMTAGEKEAVRKTNLEPLEELIDDFRRRLELWRRRMETEETTSQHPPQT